VPPVGFIILPPTLLFFLIAWGLFRYTERRFDWVEKIILACFVVVVGWLVWDMATYFFREG